MSKRVTSLRNPSLRHWACKHSGGEPFITLRPIWRSEIRNSDLPLQKCCFSADKHGIRLFRYSGNGTTVNGSKITSIEIISSIEMSTEQRKFLQDVQDLHISRNPSRMIYEHLALLYAQVWQTVTKKRTAYRYSRGFSLGRYMQGCRNKGGMGGKKSVFFSFGLNVNLGKKSVLLLMKTFFFGLHLNLGTKVFHLLFFWSSLIFHTWTKSWSGFIPPMLKIGQNWGKIANYSPPMLNKDRHHWLHKTPWHMCGPVYQVCSRVVNGPTSLGPNPKANLKPKSCPKKKRKLS